MKKNLFLVAMVIATTGYAQKEVKLSSSDVNKKIVFPPVIKELTKSDKYQVISPTRLTYLSGAQVGAQMFAYASVGQIFPIKAKLNTAVADYFFEIKATGITNIKVLTNRWHNDGLGGPKGFLKDVTYNFPAQLIVRGKDRKVIVEVELISKDEVFKATYQPAYPGFVPAASEGALDEAYNRGATGFYTQLEGKAASDAYTKAYAIVGHLYNQYDSEKQRYVWIGVKEKGRNADYTDIDSANAKQKAGYELYFSGQPDAAKASFDNAAAVYEKLIAGNDPRIDKGLKEALHYDLAWIYLLNKDFSKAWAEYKSALTSGGEQTWEVQQLRQRIQMFEMRNKLENMFKSK
ncbi:MAG TPA: hypothetical protein VHM26_08730 [Chitinophagaceae bacterium]|jgi:hypothetical protein|nr:hypothetical protein [Chitinophagaceae bacterium]